VFDQLGHEFTEEGEGGVRHHDVGLFEEFDTLRAPEVAVAIELVDADLLWIGDPVAASRSVCFS
jgi:hypothetical protein